MSTTIRTAAPADLVALLELYRQLDGAPEATPPGDAEEAFAALLAMPSATLLVAEHQGRVAGTITMVVVPNLTHRAQPWAQLENMVVDAAARGGGIGHALMAEALRRAREAGCYKVQLQSRNERHDAHRFYEREGFRVTSAGFRLYFDG
ncbi:MAG: GNAT family N-acetyltransferase [Dehalococcoidia bacterium]|nr:GNAT family N-acetyltransferase [Dehalococcoidia bacterium]